MWKIKTYPYSKENVMNKWIEKNKEKYIIEKYYTNDGFAIHYRNKNIIFVG